MVGRNDIVFSGYKSHRTTENKKKRASRNHKKKPEQDRGKKPNKTERKKYTEEKKQRKGKQRNPEKPTLTSPSPQIPPANWKKEEPKQQAVTFIITETKGKQKGAIIHRRERNHRAASLLVIFRSR